MTSSRFLTSSAFAAGLLGAAVSVQAATVIDWTNTLPSDWSTTSNWDLNRIPTAGDLVRLLDSTDHASVTTAFDSSGNFDILMRNGSSIDISANFKTVGTWAIGISGSSAVGVTQTAGTVIGRTLNLGAVNAQFFDAKYSISGGAARFTTAVNINQNGVFDITGDAANLVGSGALSLTSGGKLSYKLAADDVSVIGVSAFTIGSGALLSIDASSYTDGVGTLTLANFTSNIGTFDVGNIAITGLEVGLSGRVTYTGTTMYLAVIPESGSYALLGGLLALGTVMLRRR
jgi:hypothetical protein